MENKLDVTPNGKTKTIAIAVEISLALIFILAFLLYTRGNQFIVGNTIDGLPILIGAMVVGVVVGILIAYVAGKSELKEIKFAKLQEFIGFWALFTPIFIFGFIGYSLNLKLSDSKPESIQTTIVDKSGDPIMQTYYLEAKIKEKIEKVRVSRTDWNKYKVDDALNISIVCGYFGYDVVRVQSN